MCFGWIDSILKSVEGRTLQRFSPRRKNSLWTEPNKERVKRLEKLGLMTDAGRKVLPKTKNRDMIFDSDVKAALKKERLWSKFQRFPQLYQRIRIYNVVFYKKRDPEKYKKALSHLIDKTKQGYMYGEWDDYGRLSDY